MTNKTQDQSKRQIVALQKNVHITPRKLRLVTDLVRKFDLDDALDQLKFLQKRASLAVAKTIRQAVANATNNLKIDRAGLKLTNIVVMEGPTHKLWRPVSRGRSHPYNKRTSHIKVILEEV